MVDFKVIDTDGYYVTSNCNLFIQIKYKGAWIISKLFTNLNNVNFEQAE